MSEIACDFLERKSSSFNEKEALLLNLYDVLKSSCNKTRVMDPHHFTVMRIRIQLCTLKRIRIQLFTLMRIRILLLVNVMGIATTGL
jgi:hypothetical protein